MQIQFSIVKFLFMNLLSSPKFLKGRISEQYYKGYKEFEDIKQKTPLGNTSCGLILPLLSSPHRPFSFPESQSLPLSNAFSFLLLLFSSRLL